MSTATQVADERMAHIAQRVFQAVQVEGELIPGPFQDSDKHLVLTLNNGVTLSILPDVDISSLYEVVRIDTEPPQLHEKLTTDGVVEVVRAYQAPQ